MLRISLLIAIVLFVGLSLEVHAQDARRAQELATALDKNKYKKKEKANISIDPDDLWVRTAFVDRGPTKNRRRVRPAPQGRAYREQRHFCHVTISLSNDAKPTAKGSAPEAETRPAKPAESKRRKRGGAVAAPRARRAAPKAQETTEPQETTAAEKPATKKASKKKAKTEE